MRSLASIEEMRDLYHELDKLYTSQKYTDEDRSGHIRQQRMLAERIAFAMSHKPWPAATRRYHV